MKTTGGKILTVLAGAAIAALVAVGLWKTRGENPLLSKAERKIDGIMGTKTRLVAVVPADRRDLAERALREAEQALRGVQAKMSWREAGSEIHEFNEAAPPDSRGVFVPLSPETMEVLRAALELCDQSGRAFDVTVGALVQVWKDANQAGELPGPGELAAARAGSNWSLIELRQLGALKLGPTVRLDLGGIAKGYGIDRAAEAMRQAGCTGGLVDVGGDVRCFGRPPRRGYWLLGLQDPFDTSGGARLAELKISAGAVCTSGNYRRYYEIGGQRYSHIIDPRPGAMAGMALPPDATPASVTVFAPTAMVADGWATALSVLGTEGLSMIPAGSDIEAMLVIGTSDVYTCVVTAGFRKLFHVSPQRLAPEAAVAAGHTVRWYALRHTPGQSAWSARR